jgi:hypothetical protein
MNMEELKQQWNAQVHVWSPDKEERKKERLKLRQIEQQMIQLISLKAGMIFYESWGYDQTQNDFAVIVEVSPTKKTALCRTVGKDRVGDNSVKPNVDWKDGKLFRLVVGCFHGEATLRGTYPFCDGGTREGSFRLYENCPVYETPEGMGH